MHLKPLLQNVYAVQATAKGILWLLFMYSYLGQKPTDMT